MDSTRNLRRLNIHYKPAGQNCKQVSPDKINNLKSLLHEFSEIPIENLFTLYYNRYKVLFDPEDFGAKRGFKDLGPILAREGFLVQGNGNEQVLKSSPKLMLQMQNAFLPNNKSFKNPQHSIFNTDIKELWFDSSLIYLISKENPVIDQSPMELAMVRDRNYVERICEDFNTALANRNGIRLPLLCAVGPMINKRVFNISTMSQFVHQYPEIFLKMRHKSINDQNVECNEDIIYDGKSVTYEDIPGYVDKFKKDAALYVWKSILSGVYQRTLVLLSATEFQGLKIHVWSESMIKNFTFDSEIAMEILDMSPIEYFYKLKQYKLVNIKSHPSSKNDLRVFLPDEEIHFDQIFAELLKLKPMDENCLTQY